MAYTPPAGGSAGLGFTDGYSVPSGGDVNLEFGAVSAAVRQAGGFAAGSFGITGVRNAARFLRVTGSAFASLGKPVVELDVPHIRPASIEPPANAVGTPEYVRWRRFLVPETISAPAESFYSVTRVRLAGGYNPPPGSSAVLNWLGEPYSPPPGGVVALEFGVLGAGRVNSVSLLDQLRVGAHTVAQPAGIRPTSASAGAVFGLPTIQTSSRTISLSGFGIASAQFGLGNLTNTGRAITPASIAPGSAGAARVFNWRQYLQPPGHVATLWGLPYAQGGVKSVVPTGLAALAMGAVKVINTRADQTAKPDGIAPPVAGKPFVSPQTIFPRGFIGLIGTPLVRRNPSPLGFDTSAFGYPIVIYKTRYLRPSGIGGYDTGYPRVADRARRIFHAASVVTSVFGDTALRLKDFRVSVPGLASLEMSPWAEVRNTRRTLFAMGIPPGAVGDATAARNKTPSVAPPGIDSQQFGRLGHMVVGWRVREIAPSGVPVPLQPVGRPVLWQTPSLAPAGVAAPAVPAPFVWPAVRPILQIGNETLLVGVATVGFAYRVIVADGKGIEGGTYGSARVEHNTRAVRPLGREFMALGGAWVDRGLRTLAPLGIREPDMHLHSIGGTRYLGAEGFEATRWLTRIIPENREVFPAPFFASYGWPTVQNRKRYLRPESVRTYPEEAQRWGTARAWNLRQYIAMYEDQSSGLWPLPWPQWTAIENRNKVLRVVGFTATRITAPAINNNARLLAATGIAAPVLPEYEKAGAVSHRIRPLNLDGIEAPLMSKWAVAYNGARPILPRGIVATQYGRPEVVNLRRFYRVQGFDSAWFGYPFVADRIRGLTFESRYGIAPPRIELPVVDLYSRYVTPVGMPPGGMGTPALNIFFRKVTPRWTHRDLFGDATLRNKTPELRTRGRASDEWGNTLVRTQWRVVNPEGTRMELFGTARIADRKQRVGVPGANFMLVSDKVTVRRIGADPVVAQYIDLRIFVIPPDGVEVESEEGYGIKPLNPQTGVPNLLKGYIFHGKPFSDPEMLAMGTPTVTANTIRVEPGIFDFYIGEPDVSLLNRRIEVAGMDYTIVMGKPAQSPHTIYAVLEATDQAIRNHGMSRETLHVVRSEAVFGRPSVFTWRGDVKQSYSADGWAVGRHTIYNKLQFLRPVGTSMQRMGWTSIPGPQRIVIEEGVAGYATGRPSVAPPPYSGPSFAKPAGGSFQAFGRALVEHRHRTLKAVGHFSQAMGSSEGLGTLYMPQALHVGPKRPTIPIGFDASSLGTAWASHRVRELQTQGHDSFVSDYDFQEFAKRMRVRNADDGWGGRRNINTAGHDSARVGAPGVRSGLHYIRPDGNSDQYRKGAF